MSASYALSVGLGIVAAMLVASRLPPDPAMEPRVARAVRIAALVGGVLGAYLFELPADVLGWAPPTPDGIARLGGRTVLGGVLGGWIAVDVVKARLGFVLSTGDRFAAPLAVALSFGRLGCTLAGCCPGRVVDERSPFAFLSHALHQAPARFPAAWAEACFHALAAMGLVALVRVRALPRRHFALYCALYALVRFGLEFLRDAPAPFAGLSYYQVLAVLLFVLAASRLARPPAPDAVVAT
jgi:phosphatidylglycerol:prolipoprotein diacylglycerol transferase